MTELTITAAGVMAIYFLFGVVFGGAISLFVCIARKTFTKKVDRRHWEPAPQVRREPPLPKKPKR